MKTSLIDITKLTPDPSNVRTHGGKNLDAIKGSLQRFGQQKPIVVDANGVVVAGNGTLAAAKDLGWKQLSVVRTELKGADATAFAIADNRTAELAEWDWETLGETLRSLDSIDEVDLSDLGWAPNEVENLLKAEFEPSAPDGSDGTEFVDGGLVIKFTAEQAGQLGDAIDGEVTADAVIAKVVQ